MCRARVPVLGGGREKEKLVAKDWHKQEDWIQERASAWLEVGAWGEHTRDMTGTIDTPSFTDLDNSGLT